MSEETRDEFVPTEEEAAELAQLGHAGLKLWRRLEGKGSVAQGGTGFAGVSKRQNRKGGRWYYQAMVAKKRQIASSKTAVEAAVAYALYMQSQSQAEAAQSSTPPQTMQSSEAAQSTAPPQ